MYTISKGPSKIVAKTRRGIAHNQNLDWLDSKRDQLKKPKGIADGQIISVSKPIFHSVNGKKSSSQRSQQQTISPHHAEIISFINESWDQISKEYEQKNLESDENSNHQCIVYHNESEPNNMLQDFKPFDLESWWGKRLFNKITKSI